MTEVNSTTSSRPRTGRKPKKPGKPHKDYPLFAHASGQWAKKILGKMHYFGVWSDHQAALEKWLAEKDDLLAGRVPRAKAGVAGVVARGPTLAKLTLDLLTTKARLRDNGELSPHTWNAYSEVCTWLLNVFGRDRLLTDIQPDDFETLRVTWAKKWGPVRLGAEIVRARTVFNYAYKNGLIDRPMRYGEGFQPPSKKVKRLHREAQGKKLFAAEEIRRLLDALPQPLKTMTLFAINAGMGNNDIAQMPITAVNLDTGWLTYPRPKTGITRRCPLWPETVAAIREWLGVRPASVKESAAGLLFVTQIRSDGKGGDGWGTNIKDRPISHEFRKYLDKPCCVPCGKINRFGAERCVSCGWTPTEAVKWGSIYRAGLSFYALRHTFETIGGDSRDQVAVDAIMGHADNTMAGVYREDISDERLRAVANHVRAWLFPSNTKLLAE